MNNQPGAIPLLNGQVALCADGQPLALQLNRPNGPDRPMLIHLIAAARPNFMKVAPLYHALKKELWATPIIVHTGQHYDLNMSGVFFQDLGLPDPDVHLGIGSGTHSEQTGQVMIAYGKILEQERPDLVVVVGDVNSTLACALAVMKMDYRNEQQATGDKRGSRPVLAHLEAGLRSFDRTMPEEINRLVTDALADILWTPSPDADENLRREGISSNKIDRVGNIMIDSLEMLKGKIQEQHTCEEFGLEPGNFGLITLHRPSNVDDSISLEKICRGLAHISRKIPLAFPIHPRTRKSLQSKGMVSLLTKEPGMVLLEPVSYTRFINMVFNCRFAITDSGGIQEETTYLGIPCLTLRPNTERPITVTHGTNQLCGADNLENRLENIFSGNGNPKPQIEFWDGCTADRVVASIKTFLK